MAYNAFFAADVRRDAGQEWAATQTSTSRYRISIGTRRSPLAGWLWLGLAAGTATAIMLLWPASVPVLGGPAVLAFVVVPLLLYRQGHRHFARSATEAEADDARPPILYLRSFKDEPRLRHHEEALARILARHGPFIAIGDPGDASPRLGAARDYFFDDAWQRAVLCRLRRARLVVMLAGATPGLGWEVGRCKEMLEPARLLVVVPRDPAAYQHFSEMCATADVSLPGFVEFRSVDRAVAGLITFDQHWQGQAQQLSAITVLDPMAFHQAEEASWRHTLARLKPGGLEPTLALDASFSLREHWRIVPLAALVGAVVAMIRGWPAAF